MILATIAKPFVADILNVGLITTISTEGLGVPGSWITAKWRGALGGEFRRRSMEGLYEAYEGMV